jgi:hypothetical protein
MLLYLIVDVGGVRTNVMIAITVTTVPRPDVNNFPSILFALKQKMSTSDVKQRKKGDQKPTKSSKSTPDAEDKKKEERKPSESLWDTSSAIPLFLIGAYIIYAVFRQFAKMAFPTESEEGSKGIFAINSWTIEADEARMNEIKQEMKWSWDAYSRDAWGWDEYHPLSKSGSNWEGRPEGEGLGL